MSTSTTRRGDLMKLQRLLKVLHEELGEATIAEARVFLEVALEPGTSQVDIRQSLNMSKASASRYLEHLGRYARRQVEHEAQLVDGLALVEQSVNFQERRRRACNLTPRGDKVVKKLTGVLKR